MHRQELTMSFSVLSDYDHFHYVTTPDNAPYTLKFTKKRCDIYYYLFTLYLHRPVGIIVGGF